MAASISSDLSVIRRYFFAGYSHSTIQKFLIREHGLNISLSSLKKLLRREKLKRRVPVTEHLLRRTMAAILTELRSSGSLLGYRAMWHRLRLKYEIVVPRDIVMRLLQLIDPTESSLRKYHRLKRRIYRSKGPNFCWHLDGYDKIKPYGFAIHGCIDGFSRKVMWLHVGTSNNDPKIIGHYYLQTVQELHGCPKIIRSDQGTENSVVAYLQPFLRRNCTDVFSAESSFRYGRSTSNQRIEAWWSLLRKWSSDWWIDFFKNLKSCGALDETNPKHVECIRFSFMDLIQKELDTIVLEWNTHNIRSNKGDVVTGIPNELYYLSSNSHLCEVSGLDINYCRNYVWPPAAPASLHTLNSIELFMNSRSLSMPDNVEEALELYMKLINEL